MLVQGLRATNITGSGAHSGITATSLSLFYDTDFTISFWMYMEGDPNVQYEIIDQRYNKVNENSVLMFRYRVVCGASNFWDIRYLKTSLTMEFYSQHTHTNLVYQIDSYQFFNRIQRINPPILIVYTLTLPDVVITRNQNIISMYVNGTLVQTQPTYVASRITNDLKYGIVSLIL